MKVKVFPPHGSDFSRLDERGWLELPEGSTVEDVLQAVRCSRLKAKLLLCSLNGERVSLRTKLKDGDVIGFFSPVSGG